MQKVENFFFFFIGLSRHLIDFLRKAPCKILRVALNYIPLGVCAFAQRSSFL